jgi:hypothetical protein
MLVAQSDLVSMAVTWRRFGNQLKPRTKTGFTCSLEVWLAKPRQNGLVGAAFGGVLSSVARRKRYFLLAHFGGGGWSTKLVCWNPKMSVPVHRSLWREVDASHIAFRSVLALPHDAFCLTLPLSTLCTVLSMSSLKTVHSDFTHDDCKYDTWNNCHPSTSAII